MRTSPTPAEIEQIVQRAVADAITEARRRERDEELLNSAAAALMIYGEPATRRFIRLRQNNPSLADLAIGSGRLARWRRGDLERWLGEHRPRTRSAAGVRS